MVTGNLSYMPNEKGAYSSVKSPVISGLIEVSFSLKFGSASNLLPDIAIWTLKLLGWKLHFPIIKEF